MAQNPTGDENVDEPRSPQKDQTRLYQTGP